MASNRKHPFHFCTNSKAMAVTGVNRVIFSLLLPRKGKGTRNKASMFVFQQAAEALFQQKNKP